MADNDKLLLPDTNPVPMMARLDSSSLDALTASTATELSRLEEVCRILAARLHAADVMQAHYRRVAPQDSPAPHAALPRSLMISAAFYLPPACGFHHIEYDRQGNAYRWTGPEPTFFFELFVDRSVSLHLQLHYSEIFAAGAGHGVECFVDGSPISCTTAASQGRFVLSGTLPPRADAGASLLMFLCPRVDSPLQSGRGKDARRLGLMFRTLQLDPAPETE